MKRVCKILFLLAICAAFTWSTHAQINPTGTLTGTILDPQGAAVVGATVKVTDTGTNNTITTQTGADGNFSVPNLSSGNYDVSVSAPNFKVGVFKDIKIVTGQTYTLTGKLELGEVSTSVVVEAGGEQVVETQDTSISSTVTGRTITQLPFTSRDTLDLAVLDPNTESDGRPRNSTVAGLPKGALNITFDGINVQDNDLKSGDGFYTYIRPRVDDVEEFSMTTAANSPDKSGEGAVQIGFVSKRGTNDWHGGLWEYARNDDFNANYYFNNLAGTPRNVQRLNEFGGKIGGPVWKNHIYFFFDMDNYIFPQSLGQQPTILTPQAASGTFTYAPSGGGCGGSAFVTTNAAGNCQANLLAMAAANGNASTIDPMVKNILTALESVPTQPGVSVLAASPSLFTEQVSFLDKGSNRRHFPDARVDWDVTSTQHLELDAHYSTWFGTPDFLNGAQATFPVAPFSTNQGGQNGWRYLYVAAWRSTIGTNKTNEIRAGVEGGPTGFFIGENLSIYPTVKTNLGSIPVTPSLFGGIGGASEPFLTFAPQARNFTTGQANDTFTWTKGTHNMAYGVSTTYIHANGFNSSSQTASLSFGLDTSAPQAGMFTNANLPNISQSDLANAEQLYGTLTGLITSYTGSVDVNPGTRQFQTGFPFEFAERQFEMGVFATDSWRVRPSVTLNYGLRWEYSGPPWDAFNEYFMAQGAEQGLFGVSGVNNLFKPGVMTGTAPTYVNDQGKSWYNRDLKDFAPSAGFAWQPNFDNEMMRRVLGGPGTTVVRAGYSIAYTREGVANFESLAQGNPGYFGSQISESGTNFAPGSLTFAGGNVTGVTQSPTSFQNSFTVSPNDFQAINVFNPNLRTPMVQSYTFGIQRELGKNMALEVRYQGNHGTRLWRQYNINEVNIFENGFLNEFTNARTNLAICKATPACASTPSFGDLGLPGQFPLPTLTAAFTGTTNTTGASQSNSLFRNGTFISDLNNGLAGSLATSLTGVSSGNLSFFNNMTAAGLPQNFFIANPTDPGGAFFLDNGGASKYNALVVDFRQRYAHGLLFDFNYTYSHTDTNESFSADSGNTSATSAFFNYISLRDPSLNWTNAPFDIRHQFKSQVIYDLPFGTGHHWSSSHGFINRIIGGWQISMLTRAQSGRPTFIFGGLGGTVNQYDGGVLLNGITPGQIQADAAVQHAAGAVFWFPSSLLDANQQRANSTLLQPCNTAGSECLSNLMITGPRFFRADWSIDKHTHITERVDLELRADLLDAFNNPNFYYGGSASSSPATKTLQSTTFGRITSAYQDISTTDDPGGRILQLVARINF
ncbi:MAG TPA: carboxypeptidase-like regulatory domain-containing protein [Candidatus Acidoferrales bacterium]|nr:carboxypeptidase-like regulatory domain-containing protein [Candidatus Acidoferrales bacterium]